jgi:RNA polymerase sigma-70 factor, ECF subfamily
MTPLLAPRLGRSREASFERLYRRHVRDVYGFAYGVFGNRYDAEDVTQSTFLNAYRAFMRDEEIENMRAWLLAIAQNVCRQRFRTSSRRPKEVELDHDVAETFVEDDAPTAGEIRAAMEELAFNQRVVLVLREIEGLSYEEIAETMGITLSAVETLLFRARRALREQLEAAEQPLSCDAVERLISLQLDAKLSRQDKGVLRAHLRTCPECARLARSQRARKRVMPGLGAAPLPASLANWWQPLGAGVGAKVATAIGVAVITGGALVTTGVVPAPASEPRGGEARIVAAQIVDERILEIGRLDAAVDTAAAAVAAEARSERASRASERAAALVKANKQGSGRVDAASRTRPEGSPPTSGGDPPLVPDVPDAPTLDTVVSSVSGGVSEAQSKVTPPSGSSPVEPSPLPTVSVPDVDDTDLLP